MPKRKPIQTDDALVSAVSPDETSKDEVTEQNPMLSEAPPFSAVETVSDENEAESTKEENDTQVTDTTTKEENVEVTETDFEITDIQESDDFSNDETAEGNDDESDEEDLDESYKDTLNSGIEFDEDVSFDNEESEQSTATSERSVSESKNLTGSESDANQHSTPAQNDQLFFKRVGAKTIGSSTPSQLQHMITQKINRLERNRLKHKCVIGHIISVYELAKDDNPALQSVINRLGAVFAAVDIPGYEEFRFVIPFEYLDICKSNVRLPQTRQEKENYIENIIGAKVAVTITRHVQGTNIWILNREEGNRILRKRYFYSGFKRLKTPSGYVDLVIQNGTRVEANIVEIRTNTLILEVYGIQFQINAAKLSRLRKGNLKRKYSPGNTIKLHLLEMKKLNDKDYNVEIVSAVSEEYENDNSVQALQNAITNRIYTAVVTGYTQEGAIQGHTIGASASQFNIKSRIISPSIVTRLGSIIKVRLVRKAKYEKFGAYWGDVDVLSVLQF